MTNVYFIGNSDSVKIGRSRNIPVRKETLQTGNADVLRILYVIKNVPESFELHTHLVCKNFNKQGEWFDYGVLEHLFKNPWYKEHMERF